MRFFKIVCLILMIFLWGCSTRKGEFSTPNAPTTKLFLSSISLPDSLGKSGVIRLYWSGESQNAYLNGFEIATDSNDCNNNVSANKAIEWGFTTRTDSAFLFALKKGQQYDKISFYVRAIDNYNTKDANPPCLRIPLRNTNPTLKLKRLDIGGKPTTDTVHSVFTLNWSIDDLDGESNLDSVFIKINNSKWMGFNKSITQLTFVPTLPNSTDSTTASLFAGLDGIALNRISEHLKINQSNRVFVRAKDISGGFSKQDTAQFYYKSKNSNTLYIDSYSGNAERDIVLPAVSNAITQNPDYFDMNRNGGAYYPINWNLTFTKYLQLYKKVIWITDNASSAGFPVENGATAVQTLLNQGGKILISTNFLPDNRNSPLYQFMPFDSISSNQFGSADINSNIKFIPTNNTLDTLQNANVISTIKTMYTSNSQKYYSASFININNQWQGSSTIAAVGKNNNGKTNRIVFSIDIHRLNKKPNEFKNMIKNILITEFGD